MSGGVFDTPWEIWALPRRRLAAGAAFELSWLVFVGQQVAAIVAAHTPIGVWA